MNSLRDLLSHFTWKITETLSMGKKWLRKLTRTVTLSPCMSLVKYTLLSRDFIMLAAPRVYFLWLLFYLPFMYIIHIFGYLGTFVFPYELWNFFVLILCVCVPARVEALTHTHLQNSFTFSTLHNMCKPPKKMSPILDPLVNGMKVPVSLHF